MWADQLNFFLSATLTPMASVDAMMTDLGAAFSAHGALARTLLWSASHPNPDLAQRTIGLMRESGLQSVFVSCNGKDDLSFTAANGESVSIHDAWNMPMVALMIDHPAHHPEPLARLPECSLVSVIDEGHLAYLQALGLPPERCLFCPHGGPPPVPRQRLTQERPIDLLFVGNISAVPPLEKWLVSQSEGDKSLADALTAAHRAITLEGNEVYAALLAAFSAAALDTSPAALRPHIAALDNYIAKARRFELLRAIRDQRVTILGQVAPECVADLGHHDLRGELPFVSSLALAAQAKLLLNSRLGFERGAHERIFYAQSRGAVVLTENSLFLGPEIQGELGLIGLPRDSDALDEIVARYLRDPGRLDEIRASGLEHYAEYHSWKQRAGRILEGLEAAGLIF